MITAVLALAFLTPPPAPDDLKCMLDRIPETMRVDAIAEATSRTEGPIQRALVQIGFECARLRHWTTEQTVDIAYYAVAIATHDSARIILQREHLDLAFVNRWLDGHASPADLGRDPRDLAQSLLSDMTREGSAIALPASAAPALVMYVFTDREIRKRAAAP